MSAATGSFSCCALYFVVLLLATEESCYTNPCCRLECAFVFGHVGEIMISKQGETFF